MPNINISWDGLWQAQKKDYFISKPIKKTSLKELLKKGERHRIIIRRNHYRNGNPKTPVFQFTIANADSGKNIADIDLPHAKWNPQENEEEEERKYTYEEVMACIHGACRDGQNGYDPYDLLIEDYI